MSRLGLNVAGWVFHYGDPAGAGYPRAMATTRPAWSRRSTAFDLMVAGMVAVLAAVPIVGGLRFGVLVAIGLGMAVTLVLRRRYPLTVLAAISALALTQVVFFPPDSDPRPYDVAVVIAMYSVVKYSVPLWHAFLAAVPVAGGIVIEVIRHLSRTAVGVDPVRVWIESSVFMVAVCAAVWLSGYTMRTRRLYVLGLEERAATAERERDHLATIAVAQERATIARELHDVVAHSMAVMIVQADGATYALDDDPEQARVAIKQVAATGRDALEDMRRLVGVLRAHRTEPADPPDDRRRVGLDQLGGLIDRARSAGLTVAVEEEGDRDGLPAAAELTVFRIVQEALTNVLRHAGPGARVRLGLRYADRETRIEVVDDGGGRLAVEPAIAGGQGRAGGHGLVGMRERVAVHGGSFEAGPRLGGGWRVEVRVPWT